MSSMPSPLNGEEMILLEEIQQVFLGGGSVNRQAISLHERMLCTVRHREAVIEDLLMRLRYIADLDAGESSEVARAASKFAKTGG